MKIVFFGIPAHGHTNPVLEVIKELVNEGHEVWYYNYNCFKDKIENTGAEFVSCDEFDCEQNLKEEDRLKIGKDIAFSVEVLVNTTLALDEMVCEHMKELKPDCIVADSMAIWGKAVALKLGIPFISSTTTFAFNKESAKIMQQSKKEMFSMIFSLPKINKQIKRLRAKGYPFKNILDIIQNDNNTDTIVYTSAEFQPSSETFSDKYSFVGPLIRPVTENFVKKADKLVYISMGTVNNAMLTFYKTCIDSLKDTGFQVVISTGNLVEEKEFGNLSENIGIYQYVDQIAVLEKADVFISHCGMNSVNESLYFEVPLITYPQTSEQGGVANRVEQLGAGIRLNNADKDSILTAVQEVLNNPKYRNSAEIISKGFKKCSGAAGAAKKILEICNKR